MSVPTWLCEKQRFVAKFNPKGSDCKQNVPHEGLKGLNAHWKHSLHTFILHTFDSLTTRSRITWDKRKQLNSFTGSVPTQRSGRPKTSTGRRWRWVTLGETFQAITSPTQAVGEKNIYVQIIPTSSSRGWIRHPLPPQAHQSSLRPLLFASAAPVLLTKPRLQLNTSQLLSAPGCLRLSCCKKLHYPHIWSRVPPRRPHPASWCTE